LIDVRGMKLAESGEIRCMWSKHESIENVVVRTIPAPTIHLSFHPSSATLYVVHVPCCMYMYVCCTDGRGGKHMKANAS